MNSFKNTLKKFKVFKDLNKKIKETSWVFIDFYYVIIYKLLDIKYIKTHYARIKNFGDRFNIDLLRYFDYELLYTNNCEIADAVLTGSILQHYNKNFNGYVLGAGFIEKRYNRDTSNWKIKILRGPLSKKQCNCESDSVCYGDPGLLASKIFQKSNKIKYKLGIVPHFVDYEYVKKIFTNQHDVLIINVRKSPKHVSQDITSCHHIASSSLHGLIFADAFRIPNIHLRFGDLLLGGNHKFNDYYYGMETTPDVLNYYDSLTVNDIIIRCKSRISDTYLEKKQNELDSIIRKTLSKIN